MEINSIFPEEIPSSCEGGDEDFPYQSEIQSFYAYDVSVEEYFSSIEQLPYVDGFRIEDFDSDYDATTMEHYRELKKEIEGYDLEQLLNQIPEQESVPVVVRVEPSIPKKESYVITNEVFKHSRDTEHTIQEENGYQVCSLAIEVERRAAIIKIKCDARNSIARRTIVFSHLLSRYERRKDINYRVIRPDLWLVTRKGYRIKTSYDSKWRDDFNAHLFRTVRGYVLYESNISHLKQFYEQFMLRERNLPDALNKQLMSYLVSFKKAQLLVDAEERSVYGKMELNFIKNKKSKVRRAIQLLAYFDAVSAIPKAVKEKEPHREKLIVNVGYYGWG